MSQENLNNSPYETLYRNKRITRENLNVRRPLTPYFLFCQDQRAENVKNGDGKKLTAIELGKKWRNLSPDKNNFYVNKYLNSKKAYDALIKRINEEKKGKDEDSEETENESDNSSEEKLKKRPAKKKAPPKKEDNMKSTIRACNCGKCDNCKNKRKKSKRNKKDD